MDRLVDHEEEQTMEMAAQQQQPVVSPFNYPTLFHTGCSDPIVPDSAR